jgi:DNA-directed RNA polymerase subunit M/transcription elongation factor TFIIS
LRNQGKDVEGVIDVVRWRLKSCPRCGGDILIDKDLDNWYEQCLQCSYRKELKPVREYKEPVSANEAPSNEDPVIEGKKVDCG